MLLFKVLVSFTLPVPPVSIDSWSITDCHARPVLIHFSYPSPTIITSCYNHSRSLFSHLEKKKAIKRFGTCYAKLTHFVWDHALPSVWILFKLIVTRFLTCSTWAALLCKSLRGISVNSHSHKRHFAKWIQYVVEWEYWHSIVSVLTSPTPHTIVIITVLWHLDVVTSVDTNIQYILYI